MVNLFRRQTKKVYGVTGRLGGVDQRVGISADALVHVRSFRQTSARATEAGGQLFGTITPELVHVTKATGPYPRDERSRYRYRSDPAAAQHAIRQQSQAGLLYLGEWHTHAEDCPGASGLDDDAMRLILQRSQLNSNVLLMLIVGRRVSVDGLGLWAAAAERVHQWTLEGLPLIEP
jgi:integrative and conjugative element protein (TIGR02256 family)